MINQLITFTLAGYAIGGLASGIYWIAKWKKYHPEDFVKETKTEVKYMNKYNEEHDERNKEETKSKEVMGE